MNQEVARLVVAAEVAAERTIGQVRMAVAVFLAIVFATTVLPLAPRNAELFSRQATLAAGTMLGYFCLGVISVRLAPRLARSPWVAWLFVTCDALLILASIAISLFNSRLPPAYFPIFPSVWLVPLVLSMGALRYDARLQAYLTMVLVLGMAVATLWSLPPLSLEAPGEPDPLVFFAALPPNLIRTAMVASAGAILVLAAVRARQLLEHSIAETQAHEALGRFLPPEIAQQLASGGSELECGTRHAISVVFVDIRGFTGMAEAMTPAAVLELISDFRRIVLRVGKSHGGVVDKFIGDSVMLLFGIPQPARDAALGAVQFAFAVADEIERWNEGRRERGEPPIDIGIGAHCGLAFCGIVGGPERLEFTVLGDAVNVAARLEELSKRLPYRLVASHALLAASSDKIDSQLWTSLPDKGLRGRTGTLDLFAALPRARH